MSSSDRDFVDRLKSALNIVEVAEGYFPLTRKGERFLALCPFHREKTPSFSVSEDRQIYHCFGCGKGGDVLSLVMEMERISFPEALRLLAERAGLPMPEQQQSTYKPGRRARLLEAMKVAGDFYTHHFASAAGRKALEYAQQRGFTPETLSGFGIGSAPDGWRELQEALIGRGFSSEELLGAGLIKQNENGNSWDLFRGRIIIPIRDTQGRTIAFGGRVLDASLPKYVNSPETELFSKKSVLFNFHAARHAAAKEGFFVVVEGYMDVVAAHQRGVENVVAALGTAFTREHVAQLRRYATKVVLLFDADEGGQRATDRSVSVLLQEGLEVQVATLPDGQDPDDFFRGHDREAFHQYLSGAVEDLLKYLVRRARERQGGSSSAAATARAAREVLELLGQTRDPILYDAYVRKISQEFGIEERLVRQESPPPGGNEAARARESSAARPRAGGKYPKAWAVDESTLLLAATTDSKFAHRVVESLSETDFRDPGRKAVFVAVCASLEDAGSASPSLILERARDDSGAVAALQGVLGTEIPPGDSPEMALARVLRRREEREYRRLREEVSRSGELQSGEEADLNRRLTEFSRFHAERIAPPEDVGNHSGSSNEQ